MPPLRINDRIFLTSLPLHDVRRHKEALETFLVSTYGSGATLDYFTIVVSYDCDVLTLYPRNAGIAVPDILDRVNEVEGRPLGKGLNVIDGIDIPYDSNGRPIPQIIVTYRNGRDTRQYISITCTDFTDPRWEINAKQPAWTSFHWADGYRTIGHVMENDSVVRRLEPRHHDEIDVFMSSIINNPNSEEGSYTYLWEEIEKRTAEVRLSENWPLEGSASFI